MMTALHPIEHDLVLYVVILLCYILITATRMRSLTST